MRTGIDSDMDNPPMSRLFIICMKCTTEESIKEEFSKFGDIQNVWLVKDKTSGENKGIAYVKFSKASDAAVALEEMNGKIIKDEEKPLKVFVASSRSSGVSKKDNDEDRYLRLFIIIGKMATKEDIMEEFKQYGEIDSVVIVKNKKTNESKGVAYVKFKKFLSAALAFENSPQKYKAVFATPRPTDEENNNNNNSNYNNRERPLKRPRTDGYEKDNFKTIIRKPENTTCSSNNICNVFKSKTIQSNNSTLEVISGNDLNQDQIWRLFDIVPGLDYCQIVEQCGPKDQRVTVVYNNTESAQYAKEKLHGLQYPPGQRLIVRYLPSDFQDMKVSDNKLSKNWFCNVKLQSPKPILNSDTYSAARLFIVLSSSVPIPILKDVFCTFGSLINVYLLHNKNCGYVKYGNIKSAQSAIQSLNDAEICGVKIKVMMADAPKESQISSKGNRDE